jgi:hypothetical protein
VPYSGSVGRSLFVFGPVKDAESRSLRGAALALGVEIQRLDSPAAVAEALDAQVPAAVLLAEGCDGAVEVLAHMRRQVRFARVPVLGLSEARRDGEFGELYAQGGDDLVDARSVRPLVARLRPLVERAEAAAPARPRGSVVIAATDVNWRATVSRMVENAGLVPMDVNNAEDAVAAAGSIDVRFVVARDDLPPEGALAAIATCLKRYVVVPWVLVAPGKRATALRESLEHPHVAVVDARVPPDHLLFTGNELGRSQLAERRAAPRLLYGAATAFRPAGGAEDDVGFTYNVSMGGLYVRTLAAAAMDTEVWLELRVPTTERVVRLVGHVAWKRAFGPSESATVPPGFGVRLTGGVPGDLERWADGCRALAHEPGFSRISAWDRLSQLPTVLAASTIV